MKFLSAAILSVLLCSTVLAQKADSLEAVLQKETADSSKSILFSLLADELTRSNPEKAIQRARQGLALAEQIDFERGIFENYFSLAMVFQGQAQFDSSIHYFRRARTIAEQRADVTGQAEVCSAMGVNFMRQSKQDSSRHYLDRGLQLARQIRNYKIEAGLYNNYGNVFLEEGNLQEALTQFIKAARLYENPLDDAYGQSAALANIGNIEYRLANYDQALEYARQSMDIAKKRSLTAVISYDHKLLGRTYRMLKKYDSALEEYRQGQELYLAQGDTRSASELMQNVGNIYFDKGQYRDALANYKQSLKLARSISVKPLIAHAYSSIGQAYAVLKNNDLALAYLDSSRVVARAIGDAYLAMDNYEAISSVYEAKGDHKRALAMHQEFVSLKDSITQSENRQLTEETQAKYELEKKEARIILLEKDQELKAVALGRQRAIQVGAAIALVLVIVVALLLVNRYRVGNRARRQAEIAQIRDTIARDLHDDVGSALSTINIISKLAIQENPDANNLHLHRIADQSSRMMDSMTDMVWSINPLNDSLERVAVKMKTFANEILEPQNISYRFSGEGSLSGLSLDAEKRKNLFLIFKETINNAAKYSKATEVDIALRKSDRSLILTVSDNGQGFVRQDVKEGNGLKNMDARARAIHGHVKITSDVGKGTCIELELPIT